MMFAITTVFWLAVIYVSVGMSAEVYKGVRDALKPDKWKTLSEMFYASLRWPLDAKAALEKYFAVCAVALALLVVSPGYAQDASEARRPYVVAIFDSGAWALAAEKNRPEGYPTHTECVEGLKGLFATVKKVVAETMPDEEPVLVGRCSSLLNEQDEIAVVRKQFGGSPTQDAPPPKPKGQEI